MPCLSVFPGRRDSSGSAPTDRRPHGSRARASTLTMPERPRRRSYDCRPVATVFQAALPRRRVAKQAVPELAGPQAAGPLRCANREGVATRVGKGSPGGIQRAENKTLANSCRSSLAPSVRQGPPLPGRSLAAWNPSVPRAWRPATAISLNEIPKLIDFSVAWISDSSGQWQAEALGGLRPESKSGLASSRAFPKMARQAGQLRPVPGPADSRAVRMSKAWLPPLAPGSRRRRPAQVRTRYSARR